MTTILSKIKEQSLIARKSKDPSASLLVTLWSEGMMIGKNENRETTDAETVNLIKKFIKNNDETISRLTEDAPLYSSLKFENSILEQFLPSQLSEDQIREKLIEIKDSMGITKMGVLLTAFKSKYEGTYDGATAAKIAKSIL